MEKNKETILIVDDDELSRERINHVFSKKADYRIEEADSGKSAFELMEKSPVDIILLDVDMPEQNGFEVCRKIRSVQKFRAIPIIFITGADSIKDKAKGFDAGGNDYITKPIDPKEVKIRVKAHLSIKQLEAKRIQAEGLKAIKDMIVTYNHEMNQPLTAIQGYAEVLLSDIKAGDENFETVKTILDQAQRVIKILNKIKSLESAVEIKKKEYIPGSTMIDLNLAEQSGE